MRTVRRPVRVWLASTLAALAVAAGAVTAPAHAAPTPENYVALGDSFSAGSGVLPVDPSAHPGCMRSLRNYPNVIADRIGATLTDVTCGGAQTGDFYESQYRGVAPQFDALTRDTDLVTLTIGGNDNSTFVGALTSCVAAAATTAGLGNPCERRYGDSFVREVEEITYPAVRQALRDIRSRSPRATVAVLGYPWLLPPERGCFLTMPIARGDVPYLRELQATLNGVIERAARETGAVFVDFSEVSEGHDACASITQRWVEPLLLGTNTVPVHPNARGERAMAEHTMAALRLTS